MIFTRWRKALSSLVAGLMLAAAVAAPTRAADEAGWMFDPAVTVHINLEIPETSMDQISCDMGAERPYVPATFLMTYTSSRGVIKSYGPSAITLKVKGQYGSFRCLPTGEKAGLKLKFPSGSRPDGLKKLTLNNMVQDPSMISEALSYEVFRSLGIASPRTGYAKVTINGVYRGIYLNVETMDSIALPRWYSTTQHLYEGSYGSWWGDVGDAYSGHYEVDEGDEDDRSDLQELLDTARNLTSGWSTRMFPIADLEQMTKMWAAEWFLGHWDGYSQHLPNNYYLHADGTGRFTMLPWGTDQTFEWANRYEGTGDHAIFSGCVLDPICNGQYVDALQSIAGSWSPQGLKRRSQALYRSVIEESSGIAEVKSFINARLAEHWAWIDTLPKAPRDFRISTSTARKGWFKITWSKPSSMVPITGFALEYRLGAGPWRQVVLPATSTSYTGSRLGAGTYTLRIRSIGDGVISPSVTKSPVRIP